MGKVIQLFLMVRDLETSREFFETVLQLSPQRIGESSVSYRTRHCQLKIQRDFDREALEEFNMEPPPDRNRGAGAVFVVECEESLSKIQRKASRFFSSNPGRVLQKPRLVPWSDQPMMLLEEPNGYILELRSP